MKRTVAILLVFSLFLAELNTFAQIPEEFWAKYEGGQPGLKDKHKGRLRFDNSRQALVFLKGGREELFSIPYSTITIVSADERARRRVKETVILGVTLIGLFALPILFSKKKLRYVMVEYKDQAADTAGAAVFQVKGEDKTGVLVLVAQKAGLEAREQDLFARSDIVLRSPAETEREQSTSGQKEAVPKPSEPQAKQPSVVLVESKPGAADVELDGKFVSNTPATLRLEPGQYKIRVKKTGYKDWERTITVLAGNDVKLMAELAESERKE